jgi:hypothetical protein
MFGKTLFIFRNLASAQELLLLAPGDHSGE